MTDGYMIGNVVCTQLKILNKDVKMHIDIAKHFPRGAKEDWSMWRSLNYLRKRDGRSKVNIWIWGYSNDSDT